MKFKQDEIVYAESRIGCDLHYIQAHIVGIVSDWYVVCYNSKHIPPIVKCLKEEQIKTHEEWVDYEGRL
jgi:hypothetical protein